MSLRETKRVVLLVAMAALAATFAESATAQNTAAEKKAKPKPVVRTVAMLGYEAKWLDDPTEQKDAANVLATIVSDRLSALDDVLVVERTDIDKILTEQKLNLSGLVDEKNRMRIGKLLGARFLLFGRGFKVGEQVYLSTKVINAETGQIKGIITQLPLRTPLPEIITKVCDRLVEKLPATVQALTPDDKPELSPIEMLKRRLGKGKKTWLIATSEKHNGPPIIDPAICNELEHLLTGSEQDVKSLTKKQARSVTDGDKRIESFDESKSADYYIVGEGFSEFGQRLSDSMVTCVGRVELKVLDAKTGSIVTAGSIDSRATDLSEQLAAKQALRKATRKLWLELSAKLTPEPAEGREKESE